MPRDASRQCHASHPPPSLRAVGEQVVLTNVKVYSKADLYKPGVRVDTWTGYVGLLEVRLLWGCWAVLASS